MWEKFTTTLLRSACLSFVIRHSSFVIFCKPQMSVSNSIFYFFLMRSILRQIVAVLALVGITSSMVPAAFAVTYTAQAAADKLAASNYIVNQSGNPAAYRLADNLLRQEALGVTATIRGVLTVPLDQYVCQNKFSDVTAASGWVCRTAELSANAGLTNAANATFRPKANLSRFEALVFALRAADLVPSEGLTQAALIQLGVDNALITSSAGFNATASATRGEFFQYVVRALDAAETPELCEILGTCNPTNPTIPTGGAIGVSLASGTPASASVADSANANFTKFNITSGATPTAISTVFVTRTGLSTNTMVENIKILDENGVQVSSTGSLNSNNKAQITFSPALVVPANTTKAFYIRAGIANATASGNTVALGIESAADVVSTATISGSFPVRGNLMTTLGLDIGTLTIATDGTVTDSQPNGGDTNVVINKFQLATGSVETVTVKQIAVERQGSASSTDTVNIELFDVSSGQSVGTVATWDANGLAVFNNLNIILDKGQTKRFEVRADIIGGSGLTVNGDLTDGNDVRVMAMGNTYGFYLTPTVLGGWSGQGASNQTIQSGTLTVTKSVSTPASGNISAGNDRHLATFDFQVLGEPMKITSINIDSTITGMTYDEITNVKLINADTGALIAGPKDLVVTTEDATFTDVVILPVGTTKVKVTANLATTVANGETVKIDIDNAATGIVARGMQSNDSVTPSGAAVAGNTLTVQAGALTAVTNTSPAARSIVKGQQDFIFATATLSAANSGEDVLVSSIVVESTADVAANNTASGSEDIDNVELWADLNSGMSARGDIYETKVGDTKQFTGTNDASDLLTFNLTPTITVVKNGAVNIAVIADLSSSAIATDTFAVSIDEDSGDVTASGKDTGSSITVDPSGSGQAMTVAANGALTVSIDSSTPVAGLMLDNANEHSLTVFRLAADNTENLDVDSILITDDGTNGNDVVASYKFYNGATLLGSATPDGDGNAELFLTDGTLVIPANDYKLVTVKAVLRDIDGTGFQNGDNIVVTIDGTGSDDVQSTGLASGSAVDSDDTAVDGNSMVAYEAYPVVAFVADAGIGSAVTLGSNQLLAKIGLTNSGNKDVTFQSGDTNRFDVQLQVVGDDTDTATETVTLKDQDGTTLDTATFSSATAGSGQLDFNMSSVGAAVGTTIPAGQTKYFYIYADTSDLEDNGDVIQVWLDDTAADLTFGIGGTGTYAVGNVIFRGDIYGPVLSRSI